MQSIHNIFTLTLFICVYCRYGSLFSKNIYLKAYVTLRWTLQKFFSKHISTYDFDNKQVSIAGFFSPPQHNVFFFFVKKTFVNIFMSKTSVLTLFSVFFSPPRHKSLFYIVGIFAELPEKIRLELLLRQLVGKLSYSNICSTLNSSSFQSFSSLCFKVVTKNVIQ